MENQARDIEEARIARIEWGFSVLLSHERPFTVLHRELSRNPEFFAELLSILFRQENEETIESSEVDQNRATAAYHVLGSWKQLPGMGGSGTVDDTALDTWVTKALSITAERGRPTRGAHYVGETLSHGPHGIDGAWPHEAVRDVIEKAENPEVDEGFELGVLNSRGVVSRGLNEGGKQERELATKFAGWAAQLSDRWPRTSALLRRVATRYESEAQHEDAEAELRNDGLW